MAAGQGDVIQRETGVTFGCELTVGVVLFVVCGITGVKMGELVRESWPFIAAMYVLLFLCILFPGIVTWLPERLGY